MPYYDLNINIPHPISYLTYSAKDSQQQHDSAASSSTFELQYFKHATRVIGLQSIIDNIAIADERNCLCSNIENLRAIKVLFTLFSTCSMQCIPLSPFLTFIIKSFFSGQKWPLFWRRICQMHFHELFYHIYIYIYSMQLNYVPKGPIDNKSGLVQVMAWRRTGSMPLPEAILTKFTDAYMWH